MGLRIRATVAWALIAMVLSAGLVGLAYQVVRSSMVAEREETATAQAYVNARLLRSGLRVADPDVSGVLASLEGNAQVTSVAQVDGTWFAGSIDAGPDLIPSAMLEVVDGGDVGSMVAAGDGAPDLVVGVPIAESGARYFEVVSLQEVEDTLGDLARAMAAGAVVATLLAAVAGWYASGRVLRPLRTLSDASSLIAAGHLEVRLDASGDPDLEPLERSFNRMADTVQERIEREHRFTSDVSHELKSPVAAILSSIDIARRRSHDREAVEESLDHLQERTEAFRDLVVDLLEISRVDAGVAPLEREPLDPRALVHAVVDLVPEDPPVEVGERVPEVVVADKRRLGRALMNLLDNAARHGEGATRVQLERDGDVLIVAVEDDGPGVPAHERDHVFGRFARGAAARHGPRPGTGLGLAMVHEDLRLHGGRAYIEGAADGGARVVLEVPIDEGDW